MGVTADSVVVELEARLDGYNAKVRGAATDFDAGMSKIERAANRAEASVVQFSGRSAAATRNLGRQIADIGTGLASGQSPFLILAQQAPQVADALADTGGKAAKLAAFFAGPWGAALLAAGSIAAIFASKLLDSADAADKAGAAAFDLTKEIDNLSAAQGKANQTQEQAVREGVAYAAYLYKLADAARDAAREQLNLARARLQVIQYSPANAEAGGFALNLTASQVEGESKKLDALDARLSKAQDAYKGAKAARAEFYAAGDASASTAEVQRHERALAALRTEYHKGGESETDYRAKVADETRRHDAAAGSSVRHASGLRSVASAARETARAQREAAQAEEDRLRADYAARNPFGDQYGPGSRSIAPTGLSALADVDKSVDKVTDKFYEDHQQAIHSLASLYESAFTNGAGSIGKALKSALIGAIAQALAAKTATGFESLLSSGSNSGGVIGSVASFASKYFGGRASGGYVAPGQTVRVNEQRGGVELLRMGSQGGTVIPLGAAPAMAMSRGGGASVINRFTLDLRGALMTEDVLGRVQGAIQESEARAVATATQLSRKGLPSATARYDALGTTG